MNRIATRTLPFVLSAALGAFASVGAFANDSLLVVAELPVAGEPGVLTVQRLGRGATLSLVWVSATDVQSWRVGTVSESTVSQGGGRSPAFADFDGDGLLDLALLRTEAPYSDESIVVLRGDGTGLFEKRRTIAPDGAAPGLEAADVDGDGRADLVLGAASRTDSSDALRTYRSLGALQFDAPRITALDQVHGIASITAGDVDGDGLADVVVSPVQGSVSVWRNAGEGTFVPSSRDLFGYFAGKAILADFDRDGRPDIAYRNMSRFAPFQLEVCHNDGGGRFSSMARKEIGPASGDLAVGDENADGFLDLLVGQSSSGGSSRISVFRGDGYGSFGPEHPLPLPHYGPITGAASIVLLDWDSDGTLDFARRSTRGPVVLGAASTRRDLLAVPVLLSTTGLNGTRFDSDLLLTNAGATTVRVELLYEACLGGGSGAVPLEIGAGRQLFAPSALDFLRQSGLSIEPDGPLVGTLRVEITGCELPSSVRAAVRTTSPGGAGVSWAGIPSLDAIRGDSFVPWLVESARDRTNLGLVNAGSAGDGPITLRVTVESGDPATPGHAVLPDVVLAPGGFFQFGRVLDAAGLASRLGWARISRVAGNAPYLAWGVLNDAGSGDGSFVPAIPANGSGLFSLVIPSVIQSSRYSTELVVTNTGEEPIPLRVTLVATGTTLEKTIAPHQVLHLPDLFAELRRQALSGAPAPDVAIASPLYVSSSSPQQLLAGARVSTSAAGGRFHGLFEPAVALDGTSAMASTVSDLRQDEHLRTNLGIVNLGAKSSFRIEFHDGETGSLVATHDAIGLASGELLQLNSVLRDLAPPVRRGWARVVPATPMTRFLAYGVVMDGPEPGLGTDDGSFVYGLPE